MGKSKIEWTDYTFNPWIGCSKVSAGCANCYAERDFGRKPRWADCWGPPETTQRKRTSDAYWKKPLSWNRKAEAEGRRYRVFCASLADVLETHPQIKSTWRLELWDLVEKTTNLDWLLLTKRPEAATKYVPGSWMFWDWPEHVKIGASVENQNNFYERYPYLAVIPAHARFLSVEPMLGPVDLGSATPAWVICGGESGPKARPVHPDWVRDLRDQCATKNIPFFFKQWGEYLPLSQAAGWPNGGTAWGVYGIDGRLVDQSINEPEPENAETMLRIGKKAGRLLDGREWSQFPVNIAEN